MRVRVWQNSRRRGTAPSRSFERTAIHTSLVTDLQYPIGRFRFDEPIDVSPSARATRIDAIARLPERFRAGFAGVTVQDMERRYRPGGWTLCQLAHHVPDSHLNGLVRFKLALTEEVPTIKPYDEGAWATLGDARTTPIEVSFDLLDALHARWVALLRSMAPRDFARAFVHPQHARFISLDTALANYAWHGEHHLAHVQLARAHARPL